MSTPMIDRAMAQCAAAYAPKTESRVLFDSHSRENLIAAVIHALENLSEDATDPQSVLAAIEAVRRIK